MEAKTPLAFIVMAADAISAARPGARRENLESYIKRLESLEEIASGFEGVERSFAIQAGREVRIMVKPDAINDDALILLAHSISQKIEETLDYPGQIKVNVIRESRAVDYANKCLRNKTNAPPKTFGRGVRFAGRSRGTLRGPLISNHGTSHGHGKPCRPIPA